MTGQSSKQEHLGELSRDFAVFLPAISNFYNTFISKQRVTEGKHIAEERIPTHSNTEWSQLNFINPDKGMFTYPTALYSAGHACLDMDKVNDRDHVCMQQRQEVPP